MGREARGPSFLPGANRPPPTGPVSSSRFDTDSSEMLIEAGHIQLSISAFNSLVFIGMT